MRHITRCLNAQLAEICQRAIKLEELNAKIHNYLPENLRDQCHVASFNNSCLILVTRDPVWASQLRYALPELRDKLRSEAGIHQLASIKITVHTDEYAVSPIKSQAPQPLTKTARESLLLLQKNNSGFNSNKS